MKTKADYRFVFTCDAELPYLLEYNVPFSLTGWQPGLTRYGAWIHVYKPEALENYHKAIAAYNESLQPQKAAA